VNLMHESNLMQRSQSESQSELGYADDAKIDAHGKALFELPLVSVIVVNYNYGHLLAQALESIYSQTYPRIECIAVNNASTDGSADVLRAVQARHPCLKIIERANNDGQTAACLDGFAASSGQYIIFLDADDALLPQCIETHVLVHLSMRVHVGFTAVDMLQVVDGAVVVSTGEAMNTYILTGKGKRPDLVRPFRAQSENGWTFAELSDDLHAKVRYVPPLHTGWVWTPTSGLCFRRDAVAIFSDNENLRHLRSGTDMFYALGIGSWCGSVLIDEPLFIYRIHGSNIFTQRAQLNRTLCYQPHAGGDNNVNARALIVDQLVNRCERFSPHLLFSINHLVLLFRLNGRESDETLPGWAKQSSLAYRLYTNYDNFAAHYGRVLTKTLMLLFGVPWRLIWSAGRKPAQKARDA
jgi:glycosyltransferase involved in cell wall biosynthesis